MHAYVGRLLAFIMLFVASRVLASDTIYVGPASGVWSAPANWSLGVPSSTDTAIVDGGAPAAVVVSILSSVDVGTLQISAGDQVQLGTGASLNFFGDGANAAILNAGSFNVGGGIISSRLRFGATGIATFSGGGTFSLLGGLSTIDIGNNAGRIVLQDATVRGTGALTGRFTNRSLISADANGNVLTITPATAANSWINTGTMRATGGGILAIGGMSTISNAGGMIEALDGSTVRLINMAAIDGGTLSSSGTGQIRVTPANVATLRNVVNRARIVVDDLSTLRVSGSIVNHNNIDVGGLSNGTLSILGDTFFDGTGTLALLADASNVFGSGRLTNGPGHTIRGRGQIDRNFDFAITNHGLLAADVPGSLLRIDRTSEANSFVNSGIVRAANNGRLLVSTDSLSNYSVLENTGGRFEAMNNSTIQFSSHSGIRGGTFATDGTGVIVTSGTLNLDNVVNTGNLQATGTSRIFIRDTFVNSGSVRLAAAMVLQSDATITGGGEIVGASINGNLSRLTLFDQTIRGAGTLLAGSITMNNYGRVFASGTLTVHPANVGGVGVINNGTFAAMTGGTLVLDNTTSAAFNNSSGTIEAYNGGVVRLGNGLVINGGTLLTHGTGTILVGVASVTLNEVQNHGRIVANGLNPIALHGSFTNFGEIIGAQAGATLRIVPNAGAQIRNDGLITVPTTGTLAISGGGGRQFVGNAPTSADTTGTIAFESNIIASVNGVDTAGALLISGGADVETAYFRPGLLRIDSANARVRAGGETSRVFLLNILNGGALDLADRELIVDYTGASPLAAVRSWIVSGYAGGIWSGAGIRSIDAAESAMTSDRGALGYVEVSDLPDPGLSGVFGDQTSVLVRYTLSGDANLNRRVDISDFSILAANFNGVGNWNRGDFNYDSAIDISDFALLAANFNKSLAVPRSLSIPEPAAALWASVFAGFGRRRRT